LQVAPEFNPEVAILDIGLPGLDGYELARRLRAMEATRDSLLIAAWLVASTKQGRREAGFWWFIASNILWIAWGWHTHAWALIALQVGLFVMNLRGAKKNET
jgi:CheY-like chemotaxis protein